MTINSNGHFGIHPVEKPRKNLTVASVEKYYLHPNICEKCGQIITIRHDPSWTRKRRFCGYTCSANSSSRLVTIGKQPLADRTKGEMIGEASSDERKWWRARIHIGQHARRVYEKSGKPKKCFTCGYSLHIQICHRRSFSDFPNTAYVGEINSIENLVALCPNHHWELDHGHLKI